MLKLPPDSEALEEIDKAFKQYKENLEDDNSECSSNVTPSISQVMPKTPQQIYISGARPDYESFDGKANRLDGGSSIIAVKESTTNAKLVFTTIFLVTVALACAMSVALYTSAAGIAGPPTDVETAIAPSAHFQNSIKNTILGNIGYSPYPSSYSVFAKESEVIENPIPLLFDVSGEKPYHLHGASFILT